MRRHALAPLALALLCVCSAVQSAPPKPGAGLPEIRLMTSPGQSVALKELRGEVLLITFWATSCAICIAEMPQIVKTHEQFAARGLRSFAVAMSYDRPDYVMRYLERNPLPFPVTLDVTGAVAYGFGGVHATPSTFLIDRKGAIAARYEGAPDVAEVRRRIARLLAT